MGRKGYCACSTRRRCSLARWQVATRVSEYRRRVSTALNESEGPRTNVWTVHLLLADEYSRRLTDTSSYHMCARIVASTSRTRTGERGPQSSECILRMKGTPGT